MAGFKNIRAWVDSATDDGKGWISVFRKVPAATATIAGQWFDYSQGSGIPVPNYYASSPLVAARLDGGKGIWVPSVTPESMFLRKVVAMTAASGVTVATSQNQTLILLDYLLYYPFIDMDASGEEQGLFNTLTLPRYTTGAGVKMMIVAQAPTVGGGNFTVRYTNQAGVEKTSPLTYCVAAQPSGGLVSAVTVAAGISPFIPLAEGDTGVRSIQGITMNVANGGLAALVLVKVIETTYVREECRRPTSSPTESYGDASELERIRMLAGAPRVYDGAFLGFIGWTQAGSVASAPLVGFLETVWR